MFGNTEKVARAIADGLRSRMAVEVMEVGMAPMVLHDVALVVAGGPTHAFGLSRRTTRDSAAQQAADGVVSSGIGVRDWLASLGDGSGATLTATFDTRVKRPRVPGSAARAAQRRLRRRGFDTASCPQSFFVTGMLGPLADGEEDRARRWGEELASSLALAAAA
jgi:flavodoxin